MKSTKVKPQHTIKEILNKYLDKYLADPRRRKYLSDRDLHVLHTVRNCQTPRLGLYCFECESCGATHSMPRSCKNRFCSGCGSADTQKWVRQLVLRLPDIKYHHIVFTLPKRLRELAKRNKEEVYGLMFECSQAVIKSSFAEKYGLLPGIICVLHSNGSDLKYHPHIHQIVSRGGFTSSKELKELPGDYLFPQRVLGKRFKELFLSRLNEAIKNRRISLPLHLRSGGRRKKYLSTIADKQWIVNVDKPLAGVEKIVAYVGRYTKKSCISERRILGIEDGRVKLSYKDYENSQKGEKPKEGIISLTICEFFDRLLEHLPINGFKVVRYYGMFSSSNIGKIDKSSLIEKLSIEDYDYEDLDGVDISGCRFKYYRKQVYERSGIDPLYCYDCHQTMELVSIRVESKEGIRIYEYENSE